MMHLEVCTWKKPVHWFLTLIQCPGKLIFTRFMWQFLKSFSNEREDLFSCPVLNLEDCLVIPRAHLYLSILRNFAAMIARSTMGAQNPFHHFTGIQSLEKTEEGLYCKYNSSSAHLEDHNRNTFGQGE